MKKIPLTQGKFALVDDEDFDFLNQFKWYYNVRGYANRSYNKKGKRVHCCMHRLVIERKLSRELNKIEIVDHIDCDKLNNQRINLRISDFSKNAMNTYYKIGLSEYRGVSFNKSRSKWMAHIRAKNRSIYLGSFNTEKEAAYAYDFGVLRYHKGYGQKSMNFPNHDYSSFYILSSKKHKNKYYGVRQRGNKYESRITINKKEIFLGSFDTIIQAAQARDKYIIDNQLTKHYRRLNFPERYNICPLN